MRNFIKILIVLTPLIYISCEENQDNQVWPSSSSLADRPIINKIYADPTTINADSVFME